MNLSLEVQLYRKLVCKIAHEEKQKQAQPVAPTFASSELLKDMERVNFGTVTKLDQSDTGQGITHRVDKDPDGGIHRIPPCINC